MNMLKCIIADDEPIARQILENYIEEVPSLVLIASCKNAFEVMDVIRKEQVDLLLLDINMPKLSGLSLLKTMHKKPEVIITTAYAEYAVEGFELSVTDYLLKPFSFERFLQAIYKVQQKKIVNTEIKTTQKEERATSIFVKSDKKIIKLEPNDIFFIEAYGNYIKIYRDNLILTPQTLSDFLQQLPQNFIRIHKSYVINFDKLKLIDGNRVTLMNNQKLPIGKSFKKDLLDKIDGN